MKASKVRIAKLMSDYGICSRRGAEQMIVEGKVSLNGKRIDTPVCFVDENDAISIDGKRIKNKNAVSRLILLNKPPGCLTTRSDPQGRPTIYELLPSHFIHLHYIGRLDFNSEGLLLLTNNKALKQNFEQPANEISREYSVKVQGKINPEVIAKMNGRLRIGNVLYSDVETTYLKGTAKRHWLNMVLHEGKNREIRKICEHFDLQVLRLKRVRFGEYHLGELASAQWKEVTPKVKGN